MRRSIRLRGGTQWLPWLAMAVILVVALAVGARGEPGPPTTAERVRRIASEVRCPTCRQLSAAESDAAAAQAVRTAIEERVGQGQSDDDIRAFLVSRYGADILLKPPRQGIGGLVWSLPVAAFVCAAAGLGAAFWRWRARRGSAGDPDADDVVLVEHALQALDGLGRR